MGSRSYSTDLAIRGLDAVAAGKGGRSSVSGITATVFGCSGFLGRYVSQALGRLGVQLVFPYRVDDTDVQHLWTMGDLGSIATLGGFDIRDEDQISRAIAKSNVVINLIGADQETWNYGFEEVHVDIPRVRQGGTQRCSSWGARPRFPHSQAPGQPAPIPGCTAIVKMQALGCHAGVTPHWSHSLLWLMLPVLLLRLLLRRRRFRCRPVLPWLHWLQRIAKAVKENGGVQRFIHVSALGASPDAPSKRLRTKAAGEEVVRSELGDIATIFKLAHLTGNEDRLFNNYAKLAKALPFIPLINGGATRLQPVWVRDVTSGEVAQGLCPGMDRHSCMWY